MVAASVVVKADTKTKSEPYGWVEQRRVLIKMRGGDREGQSEGGMVV